MGIYGSGRVSGATSSVIIAGFLCLGVILLSIAAVIVLSLISLYTPNHGEQGYGERKYKHRIFRYLNDIFQNTKSKPFLSKLCLKIFHFNF